MMRFALNAALGWTADDRSCVLKVVSCDTVSTKCSSATSFAVESASSLSMNGVTMASAWIRE